MIIDRVAEMAEKYGVPMAQVSLAWLLHKNPVVAPVIGATKIPHHEIALKALSVRLDIEDISYLEDPYVSHPIVGLIPYGDQYLIENKILSKSKNL